MRYIGNKGNIIQIIDTLLQRHNIKGSSLFDFFAGTTNVGRFYKQKDFRVISSDILYLSYCLQKAYIENNKEPLFTRLLKEINVKISSLFASPLEQVVEYLNNIEPCTGFIYDNYTPQGTQHLPQPRMYFSSENGKKIDAQRTEIEMWKDNQLLQDNEYFILLACLIESVSFYANIAGVYAAFQKKWDPRAIKPFRLRSIQTICSHRENKAFCADSMTLLDKVEADIFYLDPPYNSRQYAPNYHLIETIALYDSPVIKGVSGLREYQNQKSSFCSVSGALESLEAVAKGGKYNHLVLSYNSEGIMQKEDIIATLSKYGKVAFEQFEYTRFKSNSKGIDTSKRTVFEQLYMLSR